MEQVKKRVHYKAVTGVNVGDCAFVLPVDHPSDAVSNTKWALTSRVISATWDMVAGPDGFGDDDLVEFETMNTVYIPVQEEDAA